MNKINKKHPAYQKSRQLDAFEQRHMQCHSPILEHAE